MAETEEEDPVDFLYLMLSFLATQDVEDLAAEEDLAEVLAEALEAEASVAVLEAEALEVAEPVGAGKPVKYLFLPVLDVFY